MGRKGFVFITSTGYDPEKGKHMKDPYLGNTPTLGACRPDLRERVVPGDHIFVVSGKVPKLPQYIIGGFEVDRKISATAAYEMFPELRLRQMDNNQLTGNIIVDAFGNQHPLDKHNSFEHRIKNYIIGRDPLVLTYPDEIELGRQMTVGILKSLFGKNGVMPRDIMGRCSKLDSKQIQDLRDWLLMIKAASSFLDFGESKEVSSFFAPVIPMFLSEPRVSEPVFRKKAS